MAPVSPPQGWTPQYVEDPYNPANPVGVDWLLWALDRYHVPPNSNVWADLATVWRSLLADPVQAAHVLGKLLSRLGEDRAPTAAAAPLLAFERFAGRPRAPFPACWHGRVAPAGELGLPCGRLTGPAARAG